MSVTGIWLRPKHARVLHLGVYWVPTPKEEHERQTIARILRRPPDDTKAACGLTFLASESQRGVSRKRCPGCEAHSSALPSDVMAKDDDTPKRDGPGRPPLSDDEQTHPLTVRLTDSQLLALDAYAKRAKAKGRADAVRKLIEQSAKRRARR